MTDHREQLRALADALPADGAATVPVAWLRELLGQIDGPAGDPDAPPPDFTVAQVAERFGREPSTVRGWIAAGYFPGAYHFRGRQRRIPVAAVLAFEAQQRATPPPAKRQTPRSRYREPEPDLGAWRRAAS